MGNINQKEKFSYGNNNIKEINNLQHYIDKHNQDFDSGLGFKYGELPGGSWKESAYKEGKSGESYISGNTFHTILRNNSGEYVKASAPYSPGMRYENLNGKLVQTGISNENLNDNMNEVNQKLENYRLESNLNQLIYKNEFNEKHENINKDKNYVLKKLANEHDELFNDNLVKMNKINKEIMNKDKLIIKNEEEYKRKRTQTDMLMVLFYFSIFILFGTFLRLTNIINGNRYLIYVIVSIIVSLYFVNKAYSRSHLAKDDELEKIKALSSATAKGMAQDVAQHILPSYMIHKHRCPKGCKRKPYTPKKGEVGIPSESYELKTDSSLNAWLYGDPLYSNPASGEVVEDGFKKDCKYYDNINTEKDILRDDIIKIKDGENMSKSEFTYHCKSRYGCMKDIDGKNYCLKPRTEPTPFYEGVTKNTDIKTSYLCKYDGAPGMEPLGNTGELVDADQNIYKTTIPCKFFPGFSDVERR